MRKTYLSRIGLAILLAISGNAASAAESSEPQWHRDGELPLMEAVLQRAADCEIAGVAPMPEDASGEPGIVVPPDVEIGQQQLQCLAQLQFHTGYRVDIPEEYAQQFWALNEEIAAPWSRELARNMLMEMGITENVPAYDPSQSEEEYAAALETFCGPDAKGWLSSKYGPRIAYPPETVDLGALSGPEWQDVGEIMLCLMAAGEVGGFRIGFVGNEVVPQED